MTEKKAQQWDDLAGDLRSFKAGKAACFLAEKIKFSGGQEAIDSVNDLIRRHDDPTDSFRLAVASLWRLLESRGVSVSETTVKRHVRHECACARRNK